VDRLTRLGYPVTLDPFAAAYPTGAEGFSQPRGPCRESARRSGTVYNPAMRFQATGLRGYDDAEILKEIRRVVVEEFGGTPPTSPAFDKSSARVSRRTLRMKFGTYAKAMSAAGFAYTGITSAPSAETLWDDLLRVLKASGGQEFSKTFYVRHGGVCRPKVLIRVLGKNWSAVMGSIGAKPKLRVVHLTQAALRRRTRASQTESDLFDEIKRIWEAIGRRPTLDEFQSMTRVSERLAFRLFGSWIKTVEAYCQQRDIAFQGSPRTHVTRELLLNELRAVQAKGKGDLLTYKEYKRAGGTYSIGTFQNHFERWTNAVQAAGAFSGRRGKYSTMALFDEIQRLWEAMGKQPTRDDMLTEGLISPQCFSLRFGTWRKAIHAFCADRNSSESEPGGDIATEERAFPPPTKEDGTIHSGSSPNSALVVIHRTGRKPSDKLRFKVLKRDNFTCRSCGRSPATELGVILEADHVLAYTRGGETVYENLQALCDKCNRGKSDF
jgi:hypothetical protein